MLDHAEARAHSFRAPVSKLDTKQPVKPKPADDPAGPD